MGNVYKHMYLAVIPYEEEQAYQLLFLNKSAIERVH